MKNKFIKVRTTKSFEWNSTHQDRFVALVSLIFELAFYLDKQKNGWSYLFTWDLKKIKKIK